MLATHHRPDLIAPTAWVAPNATVIGNVHVADRVSIWFGAVLRGDCDDIRIGEDSNIQDLCCLHVDPGVPCQLGRAVTVGHGAIVHGAMVDDECLIGMGAIILSGAKIGKHSIIGAGALVTEGKVIPPRSLVVGTPARVIREVTDADIERIQHGAEHYVAASATYRTAAAHRAEN